MYFNLENKTPKAFFVARFSRLAPGYFLSLLPLFLFASFGFQIHKQIFMDQLLSTISLTSTPTGFEPLQQSYWSLWVEILFYSYLLGGLIFLRPKIKNFNQFFSYLIGILLALSVFLVPGAAPFKGAFQIFPIEFGYYFALGGSLALYSATLNRKYFLLIIPSFCLVLINLRSWIFSWDPLGGDDWEQGILVFALICIVVSLDVIYSKKRSHRKNKITIFLSLLGRCSYIFYLLQEAFSMPLISILYKNGMKLHLAMILILILTLGVSLVIARFLEPNLQRQLHRVISND